MSTTPRRDGASTSPSPDGLYQEVTRAALLGLAVNLVLGLTKLVSGVVSQTFALVVDALNSLGDVFTTLIVLFALRVAQQPPDDEHPYGHSRAEGIAASNVALVIVLSAVALGWQAVIRLQSKHPLPPLWTLWIAGANVLIKEALYRYKIAIGRRTGSAALIANAWDHRSDALCALAVLIGLGAARLGGPSWHRADEVAALVVVLAIVYSGIRLFWSSASELMDSQASPNMVAEIRELAGRVPGVRGVEKLWVRKSGLEYFADIHIEVDPQMTVAEGHQIGHDVKRELVREFAALRDVLVHLEPHGDDPGE